MITFIKKMPINRKQFITTAALAGTTLTTVAQPPKKYLIHHVFFWLKRSANREDQLALIAGIRSLGKIQQVKKIHVGIAAPTEKRDVVDASWDVSEMLFFEDAAAQLAYQQHPLHTAFVEKYSALWNRVVVYDMMEV
jgi:hypothetical protein